MSKIYERSDVTICSNNYINVKGIGTVGLWWKHYDKKVVIDYSIGHGYELFANTESEVVDGILKLLNQQTEGK